MIKRNNYCPLLLFMLATLLLSEGCTKEEQPTPTPPAHQAEAQKTLQPVLEEHSSAQIAGSTVPSYLDFSSRKDPFKPFVVLKPQSEKSFGTVKSAELLPIQSYELSKFKVAGIIVGLKENRALVIDPAGKGYVVRQGMLIGDSDGRIEKITATTIEVLEKFRDDNGRMKSRTVKLTLPQKK